MVLLVLEVFGRTSILVRYLLYVSRSRINLRVRGKLQEEIDAIVEQFSNSIDTVKNNKKGVANAAKNLITELVNNPVLPYEEGEDRVLRGYKIQFESRDGRYDCVDMDITKTDKESGIRPVNILTIKWLIFNGVKYIIE